MLKGLGVKPTKLLPPAMLDSALFDVEPGELLALDEGDAKVLEQLPVVDSAPQPQL